MRLKRIIPLILFLYLLIPLLTIIRAQEQTPSASPSQPNQPAVQSPQDRRSEINYTSVCLAVAGMSAQVGGIVVVFIAFAVQELRNIGGKQVDESELYKSIHNRSKLGMLLFNASFSMAAFLIGGIITILGLLDVMFSPRDLAVISLAFFSYGTFSMLVSVGAYLILERPFWRVSLGSK